MNMKKNSQSVVTCIYLVVYMPEGVGI